MPRSANSLFLSLRNLHFAFDTASTPLFRRLGLEFGTGWTGLCGPNGCGKSTLLQLIAGNLIPASGTIHLPGEVLLCEQRTDHPPLPAADFLADYSAGSYQIRVSLGIEDEWIERWDTLSHGERKRLQVGVALWSEPSVLLLDEPTNHLDEDGLNKMMQALRSFNGVGLLVTHDRALLDLLCNQCLWFLPNTDPVLRNGGYSEGKAALEREQLEQQRELERLSREQQRLEQTARHYRREASQADRKRSNRGIDPRDADARGKRNLARVTGKDGVDGKRLRQMEGRLRQLKEQRDSIRMSKHWKTGIDLGLQSARRNAVFTCGELQLTLGENRSLHLPRLELRPGDQRILRGPNGAGKSTLLRWIAAHHMLEPHELLYLPQEVSVVQAQSLLHEVRQLDPLELGGMMQRVRRLGSDPGRLLESALPSPGELRKLMLAMGMMKNPAFLILDEPTNHLDLPSIECLQEALAECRAGYLIVSHDRQFTDALGDGIWEIQKRKDAHFELLQPMG